MAGKLSQDEWQVIKTRWETDPRPGYKWIVSELSLPVGDNAVLMRAKREEWAKSVSLKEIANKAQIKADHAHSKILGEVLALGVSPESPEIVSRLTNESIDLRSAVIEKHRAEWERHRKDYDADVFMRYERIKALKAKYDGVEYATELIEDELAKPGVVEFTYSDLFGFARCAKTMADAIKARQEGERKAWGLDATNDDSTAGMETEEQLNARYAAFMARHSESRKRKGGGGGHTLN